MGATTLGIMTVCKMTISIIGSVAILRITNAASSTVTAIFKFLSVSFFYAEFHSAECTVAECR
jgi:hypothetical protein